MSNTISPNMSLVIPTVGSEAGPIYAQDINASLTLIDQHDHSSGYGVQIKPNGLNINSDLTFQSNNATALRTARFSPQAASLTAATDIGALYVVGNELYYNDVTGGHKIAITSNGSVNAGAGSISGLPSGTASASYASGTFTWQAATATPANMDAGSYTFRNNSANSKALTLSPPAGMSSNMALTLPTVPTTKSVMTLDATGTMAATDPYPLTQVSLASSSVGNAQLQSASVTIDKMGAANYTIGTVQTNSVFGPPSGANQTLFDSKSITVHGRPVRLECIGGTFVANNVAGHYNLVNAQWLVTDSLGNTVYTCSMTIGAEVLTTAANGQFVQSITNSGDSQTVNYATPTQSSVATVAVPSNSIAALFIPAAGTYTFALYLNANAGSGNNLTLNNAAIAVCEV